MATALDPEELSTCSICYGQLINPRKLPRCFHVFCENCLLTYITNIKSNDKDSCEFQCPNCRRQIPIPNSTADLLNWVKSLEGLITDDTMASNTSSEKTDSDSLCISCKDIEASVPAEVYCIDCEESLCERCSKIRHRTKVLQEHSLIDLPQAKEDVNRERQGKLIRALADISKCNQHPDKAVSYICADDDILCCIDCVISNHMHCDSITELTDENIKADTTTKVKRIKDQIERMASNIKDLTAFKKTSVADVKRKSEETIDRIREIRMKLNTVIDALEENIASTVKAFVKKASIEAEDKIVKLGNINKSLEEHAALINSTEKLGSSSQIFIILEKLTLKLEAMEKEIRKIENDCRITYEVELKIESELDTLIHTEPSDIDRIASVGENIKIPIPSLEMEQSPKNGSLEKVAEYTILPNGCGCPAYISIVHRRKSAGLLLVTFACPYDKAHRLCCLTDENYKPIKCFRHDDLSGKPFNAICLKNGEIAVSLPEEKKICFLTEYNESHELRIGGFINTKYKPKALYGLKNGNIALSWNDPVAFGMLHFKCNLYEAHFEELAYFRNDTDGRTLKTFDFMAVDEKRSYVIQPCTDDKAVYCFDFEGNPKFKYIHEDLIFPRGVSISGDGHIFVCDQERSVIHVISPGGQGLHVLREGCPEKPLAIAFDQNGLQIAVSQNCRPWTCIRVFRLT